VAPGIPIASRAHHFLVYQTRIERHSPVGADDRSRTGDLRVGTALFFLLNYDQRESPRDIRNITALAADRRVASPARLHARQRTPQIDRASAHRPPAPLQPSRIVRDRSIARSFRDGPDEYPSGLIHFPRPHAWRVVSMMSFSSLLTFCFLFCCLVGGCGWICCSAILRFAQDRPYGRPAADKPPGEPPCLSRPDLCRLDRSATHPS
jgi:hypothetical protein